MDKWSNEKTLNFINAVYLRNGLWDVESSFYKDRNFKRDNWKEIGDEFGVTADEAYKKFRSLRTYAKNEAKKMSKKSGSAGGSNTTWFAFDAMGFILSRDVPEAGIDTLTPTEVVEIVPDDFEVLETDSEASLAYTTPLPSSRKRTKRSKKSVDNEDDAIENAVQIINAASRKPSNPYSGFGEHVANKLLGYDDITRSEVEFKISQILYKADRKMIEKSVPTPHTSSQFHFTSPGSSCTEDIDVDEMYSIEIN